VRTYRCAASSLTFRTRETGFAGSRPAIAPTL
jgi:hypothetical protein